MAEQEVEDSTLLAQVWWNRGLAEKALGHRDLADLATETLEVFDRERHVQVLAIAQKVVVSLDVTDTPTFDVTVKEGPQGFTTDADGRGPIPYELP
jgi:hypothetical protein